jgi:hypothetical protein
VSSHGATFLDIGFGQGFSLLSARSLGARAVGCDINPKCHEVIERNRTLFPRRGRRADPAAGRARSWTKRWCAALRAARAGAPATTSCTRGACCTTPAT